MAKFMDPATALSRLVEDDGALLADRVRALKLILHPRLCMLRRLLRRSRTEPSRVPSRLLAVAALAYAKERGYRKAKVKQPRKPNGQKQPNALGL
jgi:hypothetical protein